MKTGKTCLVGRNLFETNIKLIINHDSRENRSTLGNAIKNTIKSGKPMTKEIRPTRIANVLILFLIPIFAFGTWNGGSAAIVKAVNSAKCA